MSASLTQTLLTQYIHPFIRAEPQLGFNNIIFQGFALSFDTLEFYASGAIKAGQSLGLFRLNDAGDLGGFVKRWGDRYYFQSAAEDEISMSLFAWWLRRNTKLRSHL